MLTKLHSAEAATAGRWLIVCALLLCDLNAGQIQAADQPGHEAKSADVLPGLVPAPRPLPGVGRWQLARRYPRGRVLAIAWRGDATQIAHSDQTYVRLLDAQTLDTKRFLVGHAGPVTHIDWNARTDRLATSSCDGTVRLWSGDGIPQGVLNPAAGEVHAVAWSPDGSRVAAACDKGIVAIWNADGSATQTIHASNSSVHCVAWNADNSRLVAGDDEGHVKLWTPEGKLIRVCEGHVGRVINVAWSPDGTHFFSATYGEKEPSTERFHSEVRIWTPDGALAATIVGEMPNANVCWSPDSKQIAMYDTEDAIRICDFRGLDVERLNVNNFGVYFLRSGLAWSPKGRELAVGVMGAVSVVSVVDRSNRLSPMGWRGNQSPRPLPLVVSTPADDKWFARLSEDEPYRVWSADGTPGAKLSAVPAQHISQPIWSPKGDQIAFIDSGNRLSVWPVGSPAARVLLEASTAIQIIAWSPAGNALAELEQDGNLRAVRTDGSTLVQRKVAPPQLSPRRANGRTDPVLALRFAGDGKSIAVVEREAVQLIPLDKTAARTLTFEQAMPGGQGSYFWWSRDGLRMTSMRKQNKVNAQLVTWDLVTGKRTTMTEFSDEVGAIDCSPDGKSVLLGYDTGFWQVRRLDDLAAAALESESAAHVSTVRAVAFSADSRHFATGGWDGSIKIWSAEGALQQTLYGSEWPLHVLQFSQDGQYLTSIGRDSTTRLWSLKTGRPQLTVETSGPNSVLLLTADGRIFGSSPAQLDRAFLGLVEKSSGAVEIVDHSALVVDQAAH